MCVVPHLEKFTRRRKKAEYYVDLPLKDTEAFVICVHSSSQSVTPRIFSKLILRFTQFPVEFRDVNRVNLLITSHFLARVWKDLLEGHQCYDCMQGLADARAGPLLLSTSLVVNIPSPRVGEGGIVRRISKIMYLKVDPKLLKTRRPLCPPGEVTYRLPPLLVSNTQLDLMSPTRLQGLKYLTSLTCFL